MVTRLNFPIWQNTAEGKIVTRVFAGSYYITGDKRGKKKRAKYEWSAGKQI